ncbi:MAG: hypothetical protein ABL877_13430 [Thiobacillus sp.]
MKHTQQGFALIAAIILVVILAGLSAFVASMVSGQSANQQLERMTRVADLAAQAGLEWGAYQVKKVSPPPPTAVLPCPTVAPVVLIPLPGSLSAMTVNVTCTPSPTLVPRLLPDIGMVTNYQITSTATYGAIASPDYVERTKAAVFSR